MEVTIRSLSAQPTACVHTRATAEHIGEKFNEAVPKIAAHVAAVGGVIVGPPYTRYHAVGPGGFDMEIGFPVMAPISHNGEVVPGELPAVEAAIAVHEGGYDQLPASYEQIEHWITDHGHEAAEGMWETYLTDPGAQPDPSTWRTQIVWPLKR